MNGAVRVAAELSLRYDGPALEDGEMSVRELAPALLAFADVVAAATAIVDPDLDEPRVAIKAQPREGSFIVDLLVNDPTLLERARDLFAGDNVTAVVNAGGLVELIIGAVAGIKWLAGRRAQRGDDVNGRVTLTTADGHTITLPAEQADLVLDRAFRVATQKVLEPVTREGVDDLTIEAPNVQSVRIEKAEVRWFGTAPAAPETLLGDTEYETVIRPQSIAFSENHKWRVSDGELTFYVSIQDLDFLQRVEDRLEAFRAGDRFRVMLRVQQFDQGDGSIRTERTVTQVIEHLAAPKQPTLLESLDEE